MLSAIYKALILVMLVSIAVFAICRPLFIRFMSAQDFARRRNLWLYLVAASFLAPNIWLYVLVAAPALWFFGKRDLNPVAVYFLVLLAVPPVQVPIPTFGLIGKVFLLDHPRLLSLMLLLPLGSRLIAESKRAVSKVGANPVRSVDLLLLAFLVLQVVLLFPYESLTALARDIVLLTIDVVVPYFVVSRAIRTPAMIAEAMAAFVLAIVVLTPLAVVEFFRGWMLFAGIGEQWEAARLYFPLYRADFLRAQTTAGHSIFMGYFAAMAFGMWLFLQRESKADRSRSWLCMATLTTGLIVSLARGPWVGAAATLIAYVALGPNPVARIFKVGALVSAGCAAAFLSPWGNHIVDVLPFIGTVDEQTVAFRQQLAAGSWLLIQQNPFFGSPFFLQNMEDFRTGEGIIDVVNTYAIVALGFGLVGATLFVGIFLTAIAKALRVSRRWRQHDPEASLMGVCLVACVVGTLVVLATTSFLHAMPYFVWSLVGLVSAYVRWGTDQAPYGLPTERVAGIDSFIDRRSTWTT